MDSTYRLRHSLSVSTGTVKAFCQSFRSKICLIIDDFAVSLWNIERLTKAVHSIDLEFEAEVIGLEHLLQIDGYAAHLQSSDLSFHHRSLLKVWSSSLVLLYEVSLIA